MGGLKIDSSGTIKISDSGLTTEQLKKGKSSKADKSTQEGKTEGNNSEEESQ